MNRQDLKVLAVTKIECPKNNLFSVQFEYKQKWAFIIVENYKKETFFDIHKNNIKACL